MLNSHALVAMSEGDMAKRVDMAKWPQQLTATEKVLLVEVAISYGLDPLMGELVIYQGKPVVSIDGRYRKAHETGELAGVSSRPATQEERTAWEIPEGDYFFRAEVYKKDSTMPFVGWGRVRKEETAPPKSGAAGFRPLEVNPQRMAEKRAEAQALRKAFYLPLPSAEAPEAEVRLEDMSLKVESHPAEPESVTPAPAPPQPRPTPAPAPVPKRAMTPLMPSVVPTEEELFGDEPGEASVPEVGLQDTLQAALEKRWPGSPANQKSYLTYYYKVETVEQVPADKLQEAIGRLKPPERPQAKGA